MEKNTSPVPAKKKTLNFFEALKEVVDGKMITKEEWGDERIFGILKDGLLMIHKKEGYFQWVLNDGDLLGTDWRVL